jgi:hypothetical protein
MRRPVGKIILQRRLDNFLKIYYNTNYSERGQQALRLCVHFGLPYSLINMRIRVRLFLSGGIQHGRPVWKLQEALPCLG